MNSKKSDFDQLVSSIRQVHEQSARNAGKAVNISLTLRNWLIGFYVREYELAGSDRAAYGKRLFSALAERLTSLGVSNCDRRQLYRYCDFFSTYPQIVGTLPPQFRNLLSPEASTIQKVGTVSPQSPFPPERLINHLSYSHFEELVAIDDPLKRAFYEIECMRGNWSVRELKRQIGSLYYERSGLSGDKAKLAELANTEIETADPKMAIRDPYVFEFLGIKPREVMSESALEDALLDKLQEFLLELGLGFCFEARQKRILIGKTYGFIDLVFYHRILK
ncbi:DUF1016 family protein, partial [bacterium]|nr:DUF1016 family protein [bacterium]